MGRSALHAADQNELVKAVEQRTGEGSIRREITYLHRDGTPVEIDLSSVVYTNSEGKTRSFVIMKDITGIKKAENKLRASRGPQLEGDRFPGTAPC